jgi:hypothetical protein
MKRHKNNSELNSEENNLNSNDDYEKTDKPQKNGQISLLKSIFINLLKLVFGALVVTSIVFYSLNSGLVYYDFGFLDTGLLTPDIVLLYEKYDTNADGKLDIFEFEPLAHRILSTKVRFLVIFMFIVRLKLRL